MKRYLVKPGSRLKLSEVDPNETGGFSEDKEAAKKKLGELASRLGVLQELLYVEHKHKVLVVLQGMDTSGKDGVIRRVFAGVNPQGVHVANFKAPTPAELDHDYLWRVHPQVPGKGEMVIFNRSHYEDVLIVRVHGWITPKQCARRYQQIRDFERLITAEGTTLLKFFLYIDKNEQKKRLQERLEDPTKQWKFNSGDLKERDLWDEYMNAYEEALIHTSTQAAPWYIVPANRNWVRNLVVASVVVETLERLKMRYPAAQEDLSKVTRI